VAPSAGVEREKAPGGRQPTPSIRKERTPEEDVLAGSHAACARTDQ
jgi:hypothetical protein